MIKTIFKSFTSILLCVFTISAFAAPVSITQVQEMSEDGEDFLFSFSGLEASDGAGGTIIIGHGPGGSFPGMDLDEDDEFFEVTLDGVNLGVDWNCLGTNGIVFIPGAIGNIDCQFALELPQSGTVFDALLADGMIDVGVLFSDEVSFFDEGDEVQVTLTYNTGIVDVTSPSSISLIALSLLAMFKRRKLG